MITIKTTALIALLACLIPATTAEEMAATKTAPGLAYARLAKDRQSDSNPSRSQQQDGSRSRRLTDSAKACGVCGREPIALRHYKCEGSCGKMFCMGCWGNDILQQLCKTCKPKKLPPYGVGKAIIAAEKPAPGPKYARESKARNPNPNRSLIPSQVNVSFEKLKTITAAAEADMPKESCKGCAGTGNVNEDSSKRRPCTDGDKCKSCDGWGITNEEQNAITKKVGDWVEKTVSLFDEGDIRIMLKTFHDIYPHFEPGHKFEVDMGPGLEEREQLETQLKSLRKKFRKASRLVHPSSLRHRYSSPAKAFLAKQVFTAITPSYERYGKFYESELQRLS